MTIDAGAISRTRPAGTETCLPLASLKTYVDPSSRGLVEVVILSPLFMTITYWWAQPQSTVKPSRRLRIDLGAS